MRLLYNDLRINQRGETMSEMKKTLNVEHLTNLNLTDTQLAGTLGMAQSSVSAWMRAGVAPFWTLTAAEGLARRVKGSTSVDTQRIRDLTVEKVDEMIDELYKFKIDLKENKI